MELGHELSVVLSAFFFGVNLFHRRFSPSVRPSFLCMNYIIDYSSCQEYGGIYFMSFFKWL